jgi:predicted Zn-dependent peptidase
MIVKQTLASGLTLITEAMPHVRSVTVGVWVKRGSRHETQKASGISHFIEHMVFKGTKHRSAERIAAEVDSIGGMMDAFTAKEYASFHLKVLDEQLPLAVEILGDIVQNPLFDALEMAREKKVIFEEMSMVEDTPDDLVTEVFAESFWPDHPLGRPILGTRASVGRFKREDLAAHFRRVYQPGNLLIAAAGHLEHRELETLVARHFAELGKRAEAGRDGRTGMAAPGTACRTVVRSKRNLEQVHICLGARAYAQDHPDRYACYLLNTVLGGSMSSRLFQNVREKRGLAYAVFSGLSAYRDAGSFTVYAGCSNEAVSQVIDLVVEELRGIRLSEVPAAELQRSKDHLKGSLMLSLENTASRMSHLARQEIYFDRQFGLDETLQGVERVTPADVQRVAADVFKGGSLSATVLGNVNGLQIPRERLDLG